MSALITKKTLKNIVDLPVSLPSTRLRQGDWLVVSSFILDTSSQATFGYLGLEIESSSIAVDTIGLENKISGSLGLAYVGLYKDYNPSASPHTYSAVDVVIGNGIGITNRIGPPVLVNDPGVYHFVVASNVIGNSVVGSIDFTIVVTGQIRITLAL